MAGRTALVLGGGATVWTDVRAALELGEFAGVVTCNDVTADWPGPVDGAASLHAEKWPLWLEQRRRRGYPAPARVFGHLEFTRSILDRPEVVTDFVEFRFPTQRETGSSGLFALKVALVDLGFDRAVLCGVPMDARAAHYFTPQQVWNGAQSHRRGWVEAAREIADRARSMSGWTAELLGRPTPDWLA